MARPRIFISSTFFDLRQVRADLDLFVKELGYDTVRNETGGIPYGREEKLEEYCYKEISGIDILVGIVGGRFGSEAEKGNYSITQIEIKTAIQQNKQVYIFIEKNVLAEYQTYLINKDNETTKYRFVDDIKIYKFIEEIYSLPKNNIIHPFETTIDITTFLREQWAGLFRDLLQQEINKKEYESISQKVTELNEVSSTLQKYLENVLKSVSKEQSVTDSLIHSEKKRLEMFHLNQKLKEIGYLSHLESSHKLRLEQIIDSLRKCKSLTNLKVDLNKKSKQEKKINNGFEFSCMFSEKAFNEINEARILLGLDLYKMSELEQEQVDRKKSRIYYDPIKERKTTANKLLPKSGPKTKLGKKE